MIAVGEAVPAARVWLTPRDDVELRELAEGSTSRRRSSRTGTGKPSARSAWGTSTAGWRVSPGGPPFWSTERASSAGHGRTRRQRCPTSTSSWSPPARSRNRSLRGRRGRRDMAGDWVLRQRVHGERRRRLRRAAGRGPPASRLSPLARRPAAGERRRAVGRPVQLPAVRRAADRARRVALRAPLLAARRALRPRRRVEPASPRDDRRRGPPHLPLAPRRRPRALGGGDRGSRLCRCPLPPRPERVRPPARLGGAVPPACAPRDRAGAHGLDSQACPRLGRAHGSGPRLDTPLGAAPPRARRRPVRARLRAGAPAGNSPPLDRGGRARRGRRRPRRPLHAHRRLCGGPGPLARRCPQVPGRVGRPLQPLAPTGEFAFVALLASAVAELVVRAGRRGMAVAAGLLVLVALYLGAQPISATT